MVKWPIQYDIIIVSIYAISIRVPKYIKQRSVCVFFLTLWWWGLSPGPHIH